MGFLVIVGKIILRIIGFGIVGLIKGSLAAIAQSMYYEGKIVEGSLFSLALMKAMTA